MQQSNKQGKFNPGSPLFGVAMGLAGVAVALCFIYFGWRTLLILALFVLGYVLGTQCAGIIQPKRVAADGSMQAGLITGIVGIIVALGLIHYGFWRTLFIALLFVVGYVLGSFGYNALKKQQSEAAETAEKAEADQADAETEETEN